MAARDRSLVLVALVVACGAGVPAASPSAPSPRAIDDARARDLDAFVAMASAKLRVPGAAVAVIASGRVVYERSIGVERVGAPDPVTPTTRFLIGSITKPMTTLMEASLVDTGTVRWDTPITTLLPGFAVGDPSLTERLVLWHMSCACTGMPQQDLEYLFEFDGVTAERRIDSMRTMKPIAALGAEYHYSNLMVAAGGYGAARALAPSRSLGDAYDLAMKSRVFDPIGMIDSTLDFALVESGDYAKPHALAIDGAIREIPLALERSVLPIRPAGGVWSTLRDMERYVLTELSRGLSPDGKRVASEANVVERRKLRIHDGPDGGYGLGIDVGAYDGTPMLAHDGGSLGFGASMFMLPDRGVGIVVLTNVRNGGPSEQLPFNAAVKRRIFEALFDRAEPRAEAMVDAFVAARRELDAKRTVGLERDPDPRWVESLVGTYANAALGKVTIRSAAHGGVFDAGEWSSAFGRTIDASGAVKVVFVDPPFAGGDVDVVGDTLVVGGTYVLARKGK